MRPLASPAAKAVVFDLDGTLLDTMAAAPLAYVDTIRALDGPELSPAQIVEAWHLGPTSAVLAHFLGRPVSTADLAYFYCRFEEALATAQPFPGVVEMLDRLVGSGYGLAVFTTATRRAATFMLGRAGLDHFPVVVGGDEAGEPKPAPAGLEVTCERLGVRTDQVAYVGDADVDLLCAQNAGSVGIHALWGTRGGPIAGRHLTARDPDDLVDVFVRARREDRKRL